MTMNALHLRNSLIRFALAAAIGLALPANAGCQDLDRILSAVVGVRSEVPDEARTAPSLGTRRSGSGVVIDGQGLILTVGYLVMESRRVFVATRPGEAPEISATFVAYDHATGFGLVRADEPLDVTPMALGDSDAAAVGSAVIIASYGGQEAARPALVVDRREFAGYWEYLLPDALFTAPPHALFGGAALISPAGRLLGIGSLIVDDARAGDDSAAGNMFIPVNRLKPILGELLVSGRGPPPFSPWLGLHGEELQGRLFVRRVSPQGPADRAGVPVGAIVTAVNGAPVTTLAGYLRRVWSSGDPGVTVSLTLLTPDGSARELNIVSGDRYGYLLDPAR